MRQSGQQIRSDPQPWQSVNTNEIFRNRWLGVNLDTVLLPGGRSYEYTLVVPPAAGVGVIGFNEEGLVLLEREYRHGVGRVIWQLPGGLARDGEDLQAAGLRELREETGYSPAQQDSGSVRYLGAVWDNPALGPGCSHLFAAWHLDRVSQPAYSHEEQVVIHWKPVNWLKEAIRSGQIQDRTLIAAVTYLMLDGII
jgi:8-oxo-dGTP pyrophosphatase MutT (NUDIX family)